MEWFRIYRHLTPIHINEIRSSYNSAYPHYPVRLGCFLPFVRRDACVEEGYVCELVLYRDVSIVVRLHCYCTQSRVAGGWCVLDCRREVLASYL